MNKNEIYERIKQYFPLQFTENHISEYLVRCLRAVAQKIDSDDLARLNGSAGKSEFKGLVEKYSSVPKVGEPAEEVLESIVNDLFSRVPRWRSPELQYNVGTAVNSVALALKDEQKLLNMGVALTSQEKKDLLSL